MKMATIHVQELDGAGTVAKTYVLTTTESTDSKSGYRTRLDLIPITLESVKRSTATSATTFINTHIAPLFLPNGYPHSVTPDYTPYQVYDSLQAFTSSIAGLLSSRAVLQSLGMDSGASGSSTATYATLLSIAQSTISNLSSILFADYMSGRINAEVKFYRFLADIFNDTGMLFEIISPMLPEYLKIPVLCFSSALRAMCGVAGGSSKAILSAHFAVDGNIGELNAKDGSQETLINLLGMWVGGVVVSRVEGLWATWCWMIVLLGLHLWFNWLAITSVRLRGLNLQRAGMVFNNLIRDVHLNDVDSIGKKERVFGRANTVRDDRGNLILTGEVGSEVADLTKLMGSRKHSGSKSEILEGNTLQRLLHVFAEEQYLLWLTAQDRKAIVLFKEGVSRDDQLKAWCHAIRVAHYMGRQDLQDSDMLRMISDTLSINNSAWQDFRQRIADGGWDVTATVVESTPSTRLRLKI